MNVLSAGLYQDAHERMQRQRENNRKGRSVARYVKHIVRELVVHDIALIITICAQSVHGF